MKKHVTDLQIGDMFYYHDGDLVEVTRVRGRDFVRDACGETRECEAFNELEDNAFVSYRWWEDGKWHDGNETLSGEWPIQPVKHVVIPAGEYTFRNMRTGDEYRANVELTVGYQWETTV